MFFIEGLQKAVNEVKRTVGEEVDDEELEGARAAVWSYISYFFISSGQVLLCLSFFLFPIANMIKSVEIQGVKAILYEDYSHHWEDTLFWVFLLQKYLITRWFVYEKLEEAPHLLHLPFHVFHLLLQVCLLWLVVFLLSVLHYHPVNFMSFKAALTFSREKKTGQRANQIQRAFLN